MASRMFENPAEFQKEVAALIEIIKSKPVAEAEPLVAEFKKKYASGAEIVRGADCVGCTTCTYCSFCPALAPAVIAGHSMYVWAFNG